MTITDPLVPDVQDDTDTPAFPMERAARCPFDPPPELREQQEHGSLGRVRLWDGSTPWLVSGYAEQRTLLAHPDVSADITLPGYPMPPQLTKLRDKISFIVMDDPEHARLRRMVIAPFSVRRMEALRPSVQRIVDDLIDDILAGPKPVDLVEALALPVPSLVICALLGVPYADHDFFQRQTRAMIRRTAGPEDRTAASDALAAYLDDLMRAKIAEPADDLLSILAAKVTAGELTRTEAARMGVLLLVAGHETTANMIALGTLALLEHPDQLAELRTSDDPKLVASAVEELLRYLHITHNGRRRVATADIEIGGETIRAGEGIILAGDIGNRDPDVFADPARLDLHRDARHHVAFGFGAHQCLGQTLARVELQVVYGTLYRRIPTLALAADLADIPFKHDGSIYGVYSLPVTW